MKRTSLILIIALLASVIISGLANAAKTDKQLYNYTDRDINMNTYEVELRGQAIATSSYYEELIPNISNYRGVLAIIGKCSAATSPSMTVRWYKDDGSTLIRSQVIGNRDIRVLERYGNIAAIRLTDSTVGTGQKVTANIYFLRDTNIVSGTLNVSVKVPTPSVTVSTVNATMLINGFKVSDTVRVPVKMPTNNYVIIQNAGVTVSVTNVGIKNRVLTTNATIQNRVLTTNATVGNRQLTCNMAVKLVEYSVSTDYKIAGTTVVQYKLRKSGNLMAINTNSTKDLYASMTASPNMSGTATGVWIPYRNGLQLGRVVTNDVVWFVAGGATVTVNIRLTDQAWITGNAVPNAKR